ncbi:hypothetical protein MSA03_24030 [Microbacterium saccharophilum]|nr:hypothetical protein MSA03_24030 [Microbacterium saccharophilum]
MVVDLQAEADLLEDRVRLVATCFLGLLRRLVLELAVVHDLDDRGLRVRGDFDQVQLGLLRQTQGDLDTNDADLLSGGTDEANLGDADAVVGAGIADAELLFMRATATGTQGCISGGRASRPPRTMRAHRHSVFCTRATPGERGGVRDPVAWNGKRGWDVILFRSGAEHSGARSV